MDHNKNMNEERTLSGTEIESGKSVTDKTNTHVKDGDFTDTAGVGSSIAVRRSTLVSSDHQLQETSGAGSKTPAHRTPKVITYGLQPNTLENMHKPTDNTLDRSVVNSSDAVDEVDSNTVDSVPNHMTSRSPRQRLSENSTPLREKCHDHEEVIKMFCQQHDQVCCSSCIAIHHRSCKDVFYIPKLSKSILDEERKVQVETFLANVLTDLKEFEKQRTEELGENEKDWSGDLEEIKALKFFARKFKGSQCENRRPMAEKGMLLRLKKLRDRFDELTLCEKKQLMSKIEELESKSENDIREQRSEVKRALKEDILMIQDLMKSAEIKIQQLNQNKEEGGHSEFVTRKLSKTFLLETESVLKETSLVKPDIMKFYLDKDLQKSLDSCKSFGELKLVESGCATMLLGKFNLKTWRDTSLPRIYDLCITCTGDVLVTDISNSSVKRLDKSFRVREQLVIAGGPFGICETLSNRVAVTMLDDMKVQFVDLTTSLKRGISFKVGVRCRGICYSREELFISCGGCIFLDDNEGPGHIRVFNMTGMIMREIPLDAHDNRIFDIPRHLTASPDGENLYVADNKKGLLVITRDGRIKEILNESMVKQPSGVCLGKTDGSQIFVCSVDTNTVYHLENNGTAVSEPLGRADGLYRPMAVKYCPQSRELFVTSEKRNEQLIVFRMITETEI